MKSARGSFAFTVCQRLHSTRETHGVLMANFSVHFAVRSSRGNNGKEQYHGTNKVNHMANASKNQM